MRTLLCLTFIFAAQTVHAARFVYVRPASMSIWNVDGHVANRQLDPGDAHIFDFDIGTHKHFHYARHHDISPRHYALSVATSHNWNENSYYGISQRILTQVIGIEADLGDQPGDTFSVYGYLGFMTIGDGEHTVAWTGMPPGSLGVPGIRTVVDDDPVFAIGFRRVYATVLERWLGLSAEGVLGRQFDLLDAVVGV